MNINDITIFKNKKCNTWYTRYRKDGKQHYISGKTKEIVAHKLEFLLGEKRIITDKDLYLMDTLKEDYLAHNRQDDRIAIKVQELVSRPVTRYEIKFYKDVLRDFGINDGNIVVDVVIWLQQKKGIETPTISRIYSTICEMYGEINPQANKKINKLISLYKRKNPDTQELDYRIIVLDKLKTITNEQAQLVSNYIDLLLAKKR